MPDQQKRAPRIKSFSLQDCSFIQPDGTAFKLNNLSSTGVGIIRQPHDEWPETHETMGGTLQIEDNQVKLKLTIMRKTADSVGCSYTEEPKDLKLLIYQRYHTEFSALELRKVTNKILREQPDGTPHWFFDGSGGELYFVEQEGKINRYLVHFEKYHIEGTRGKPPVISAEIEDGLQITHMTLQVRQHFLRFINNIENLGAGYRNALEEIFRAID